MRDLLRWLRVVFTVAGIFLTITQVFTIRPFGLFLSENEFYYLLIALFLPQIFLLLPARQGHPRDSVPYYDLLFASLSFASPFYLFLHVDQIAAEGWALEAPLSATVSGVFICILGLEAMRRSSGWALFAVCFAFTIYPFFAGYLPGIFMGVKLAPLKILNYYGMSSESFLGVPMQVFGGILFGYLLFAAVLLAVGGGKFFVDLAMSVLGNIRGGAAKVSVAGSGLMGSLSGSAIVNVITTGTVTIPAMKRTGYPGYYAGAVEACASTGGVIMPPVMGTVAFLLAQFVGVTYAKVCIAAAVPCILYYLALYLQADFYAARKGIRGLPKGELPPLKQTLKGSWLYLAGGAVLVYAMFFLRLERQAPFYAVAVLLILSMARKETRLDPKRFVQFLEDAGKVLAQLGALLAPIGLVFASLALTGLAYNISTELARLAGGNMTLLVIVAVMLSYLLGMGAPATAVYIFTALTIAPALIQIGMEPIVAHFFCLYCGVMSYIIPPVAFSPLIASQIAEAPFMKTAWQSMRLGIMILFLPFLFVISPSLLMTGSVLHIVTATITALAGVVLMSAGIEGYMFKIGPLTWVSRLLFLVSGAFLIVPLIWAVLPGIAVTILAFFSGALGKKRLALSQ